MNVRLATDMKCAGDDDGSGGPQLALFHMPNLNRFDILSISIFCKIALSISISISIFSKITISISISISIFLELPYRYRYFQKWPYRYWYRYRYFSKVSIYRQSICHIDISNRATLPPTPPKKCTEYTKNPDFLTLPWITFLEQTGMWPDAFKMLLFEEDHMWRCVEREGQAKTRVPLSPASTWSTQASLSSMLRWYKVLTYRNNIALSIFVDMLAELTNTNTQYQKPRSK